MKPLLILLLAATAARAQAPALPAGLTAKDWHEDLRTLATELPKRHANAFHLINRQQFDSLALAIDRALDRADNAQTVMGLATIVASIGDGHTGLRIPGDWGRFPVVMVWYGCIAGAPGPCELRVARALPAYESALGRRVLAINGVNVADVHKLLTTIIPKGESDGAVWGSSTAYMQFPHVLHGLGVLSDTSGAVLQLQADNGSKSELRISPVPRATPADAFRTASAKPLPVSARLGQPVWWTMLDSTSVYFAFDAYPNRGTLKAQVDSLFTYMHDHNAKRLIIDLRRNSGGDFTKIRGTLIPAIQADPLFHDRGNLFTLIGPATFSAAMTNAVDLRNVGATLVGLPTGARPNGYQEGDHFELPHSHLQVGYSTKFYKFQDADTPGVMPDKRVEVTWDAFRAGRDTALEWILAQPFHK